MNPLDFRPGHALTFLQNGSFDFASSTVTAVVAHPFGVLKTLWQSDGVSLSNIRAKHLMSGIEVRLFSAPLFLVLGSSNYLFKGWFSNGGEKRLTLPQLFAAAALSAFVAAPFYQGSDFGVYHHNLRCVNGENTSLVRSFADMWSKAGLRGWSRTFPITATLGAAGCMSTLALAPYMFCKNRAEGRSYEFAYGLISLNALVYAFSTQPLDTIRVRGQQAYQVPLKETALRIYREEGVRVFWRGGIFRAVNQVASVISYVTFQCVFGQKLINE